METKVDDEMERLTHKEDQERTSIQMFLIADANRRLYPLRDDYLRRGGFPQEIRRRHEEE